MPNASKNKYPELPKPYEAPTAAIIDRYYSPVRDNRYYGLFYELSFMPGAVYIELNHRFYCGYYCDAESHPHAYRRLETLTKLVQNNGASGNGLLWRYTTELNMKHPSDEHLIELTHPEKRARMAERMADDLYDLWRSARKLHEEQGHD